MEQGINTELVKSLIRRLRSITLAVEIAPFAYTAIHIFVYAMCFSENENFLWLLDTLFYVSPLFIALLLVESRILKLCKWHKTACALPFLSQVPVFIDRFVLELTNYVIEVYLVSIIVTSVLLLFAAYKVFFCK